MNFTDLLLRAKAGDQYAIKQIFSMYRNLLFKESVTGRTFDADLYQELCLTLFRCIGKFTVRKIY